MSETTALPPVVPPIAPSIARASAAARLRSLSFDAALALWTGLFGLAIPVFMAVGAPRPAIRAATRLWVRGALAALRVLVGLDHRVVGTLPAGPSLIVANHQSTWETFAALLLFPDVAIVAKRELLAIPVFGWYLRRSGMITIDRADGPKALREMITQSRATLAEGRSVLIFPEGTRRDPEEPVAFKRGAELLYGALGVPAVPVSVDSGRYWSARLGARRAGTIRVVLGEAIAPGLSPAEFARTAEAVIEAGKRAA